MMRCAECKFYDHDNKQCRRHAPTAVDEESRWLALHDSELLRDIAWSLRQIAKSPTEDGDRNDDVQLEATESNFSDGTLNWPNVGPDDWCGEFQPKSSDGATKLSQD